MTDLSRCQWRIMRRVSSALPPRLTVAYALVLPFVSAGALAQLSDDDRKCLDAVYHGSRKVAQQEFRGNWRDCIRNHTDDQAACIDVDRPKSADQGVTLTTRYDKKCNVLPAFGVNSDVGVIIDAAQDAADTVIRNKWGSPVDPQAPINPDGSTCHNSIAKGVAKLGTEQWKRFRKCVKARATVDDIGDIESCINDGIAAGTADEGPDLISDVTGGSCAGPIPSFDDGDCGGLPLAAAARCIIDNVECEVCHALNVITGANASCTAISGILCHEPPIHKCTFDEQSDNSNFGVFLGGNTDLSALFGDIAGAIDISCPPESEDGNGQRACDCNLQTWTPLEVTGYGFLCLSPVAGCPMGEMDCDGGNPLGIDALDDHQIGPCTSHGDCANQCDTYCAGLGRVQWLSGCENFCQGGSRDGLACICDLFAGGGCSGGVSGVNDCPAGRCVGKNNEADGDCQCQCIDYLSGGPSSPGDFQCNLGAQLKFVGSLPCTNPPFFIYPISLCIPLTSQSVTGETISANEDDSSSSPLGPHTLVGAAETCATFDTSVTTGDEIVSNIGIFDTTWGDMRFHITLDCE